MLQPFEQLLAEGADDRCLRVMDMGIDQARQDERIAPHLRRDPFGQPLARIGAGETDAPVLHHDQPIAFIAIGILLIPCERIIGVGEERGADRGNCRWHVHHASTRGMASDSMITSRGAVRPR